MINDGKISLPLVGKIVGVLSTSVLSLDEQEELLVQVPHLYLQEALDLLVYLEENQLCPITQRAHYSYSAVQVRLDEVMENEKL